MRAIYLGALVLSALSVVIGCRAELSPEAESEPALGAGFRYSTYGPRYDPGSDDWADVGRQMASRFPILAAVPNT